MGGTPQGSSLGREEGDMGEPFGRFPHALFLSRISFWRAKRNPAAGGKPIHDTWQTKKLRLRQEKTVSCAGAWTNTLKSDSSLPAAPSETPDSRPAPACSPPRPCPLRSSARPTGVQGRSPAALFPRFLSR